VSCGSGEGNSQFGYGSKKKTGRRGGALVDPLEGEKSLRLFPVPPRADGLDRTRAEGMAKWTLQEMAVARIEGVDPKQTTFLMRQVFKKVRKLVGRDLTPQKIQARVPRVFWVTVLNEWLLGQKAKVPERLRALVLLRTAVRVGCPF